MCPWPRSWLASPAGLPLTSRVSSFGCLSRPDTTSCRSSPTGPTGSCGGRPSSRSPGGSRGEDLYAHLTRAELYVIAPLTANTLAKLAHGIADNLVTGAALAHRGPLLVAPAMNPRMWAHPATQANVSVIRGRGRRADRARRRRDRPRANGRGADVGARGDLRGLRLAPLLAKPSAFRGKPRPRDRRRHTRAARRRALRRQPLVRADGVPRSPKRRVARGGRRHACRPEPRGACTGGNRARRGADRRRRRARGALAGGGRRRGRDGRRRRGLPSCRRRCRQARQRTARPGRWSSSRPPTSCERSASARTGRLLVGFAAESGAAESTASPPEAH